MNFLYDLISFIPIVVCIGSFIIAIVFLVSSLITSIDVSNNDEINKESITCGKIGIVSFLIFVLSFGHLIWYQSYAQFEKKLSYTVEISAVEDTSQVSGSRYYISTDEYYKIIEVNGNKKFQTKIPSKYADIIEDGECKLYCYEQITGNSIIDALYKGYSKPNLYELHIPKNSVTDKYNIDLK